MKNWMIVAWCILFFAGCGYYNTFYNARRAYEKKQYEVARKKCDSILSKKSQNWLHDDVLYLHGLISFEQSKFNEALYYFERLHTEFPQSSIRHDARKKIIEIYLIQQQFAKAYEYVKAQVEADPSQENTDLYVRVLFSLRYEKELKEFVSTYASDTLPGMEYWVYYYRLSGQTNEMLSQMARIENVLQRMSIAENIFFDSFDRSIWDTYFKNSESYKPYDIVFKSGVTIADIDDFLNSGMKIDLNRKVAVIEKVLDACIIEERFSVAKYCILKLKGFQLGQQSSSEDQAVTVQYSTSIDQLFDQPVDWRHVFTNGTFFYIFTDLNELYKVDKKKWVKQSLLGTPSQISKNSFVYWDATFQRWIFFDPTSTDRVVNVLQFSNFQWDTIRLENNDLPEFSSNSFYIYQNNAYVFYSINKLHKLTFEKDRILNDVVEISGYVPPLTGYTTLYIPLQGVIILIGGKVGETDNPLAYALKVSDPIPQWRECFPSTTIDWNKYIVKILISQSGVLATLWKSETQAESGNKELYKTYAIFYKDGLVDIKESSTVLIMPVETLDFNLLNYRLTPLVYYYKDTKTSFSNLKFVRMTLTISAMNIQKTSQNLTASDAVSMMISRKDYNQILRGLEQLTILFTQTEIDYHRIGDVYLYDLNQSDKALEMYGRAFEKTKDPSLLYAIGYIYYRYNNNIAQAVLFMEKFLQSDSSDTVLREKANEFVKRFKKN